VIEWVTGWVESLQHGQDPPPLKARLAANDLLDSLLVEAGSGTEIRKVRWAYGRRFSMTATRFSIERSGCRKVSKEPLPTQSRSRLFFTMPAMDFDAATIQVMPLSHSLNRFRLGVLPATPALCSASTALFHVRTASRGPWSSTWSK